MPEFHVGDRVQIISPKARVERMAVFKITEFRDFDGELCATGEGHAWWPVAMLDHALTPEQKCLAEMLERTMHAASTCIQTAVLAEKQASEGGLPGWMIKRIRDAAQ